MYIEWRAIEISERDRAYGEFMQIAQGWYEAMLRSLFLPAHLLGPRPPSPPREQKRLECVKLRGLIGS